MGFGNLYLPCILKSETSAAAAAAYINKTTLPKKPYNLKTACIHASEKDYYKNSQGASVTVRSNAFESQRLSAIGGIFDTFKNSAFTVGTFSYFAPDDNEYVCDDSYAQCVYLAEDNKLADALLSVRSLDSGYLGKACLDYQSKRCCLGNDCGPGFEPANATSPGGICLDGSVCVDFKQAGTAEPTVGPSATPVPLPSALQAIRPTARPTSIPQPDCAGSEYCPCKEFAFTSNVVSDIFGEDFNSNMRNIPVAGGIISSIDDMAANVWLGSRFGITDDSTLPEDMVANASPATRIKYFSGCNDEIVCGSTINIKKYTDKDVTGRDICVSEVVFGKELRNISLDLPSKIVVTPSGAVEVSRDKTSKMLVAADANDPQREMYAQLATSCFEHIPYSTIVYEALEKPYFNAGGSPIDINGWLNGNLDPDNGESTTDNPAAYDFLEGAGDAVIDAANGIGTAYTTGHPLKPVYDAAYSLIKWGGGPHWGEAMVKNNLLYGTDADIRSLYNQCEKAPNGPELCGSKALNNEPSKWYYDADGYVKKNPKVGRDFVMNLNEEFLDRAGMPGKQVHAIKQNLATCLDCAHEGKIATAIGCIPVLNLQSFIAETVFGIGLSLAGAFCILNIIVAAIRMQVSRGVPAEIEKRRKMITNSLIGILIIIFALFILRFDGVTLLRIPGLS